MIRPPPRSPLFPYPTLFRSPGSRLLQDRLYINRGGGRFVRDSQALPPMPTCTARDRKSTRLNSSHSQISYAVFCLKKKKNTVDTCVYVRLDVLHPAVHQIEP